MTYILFPIALLLALLSFVYDRAGRRSRFRHRAINCFKVSGALDMAFGQLLFIMLYQLVKIIW